MFWNHFFFILFSRQKSLDKEDKMIYINKVKFDNISGDDNEEVTPVPIPNTAVKLFDAKDTQRVTAWENRKLPELFIFLVSSVGRALGC